VKTDAYDERVDVAAGPNPRIPLTPTPLPVRWERGSCLPLRVCSLLPMCREQGMGKRGCAGEG
jgi:hypothetical protein